MSRERERERERQEQMDEYEEIGGSEGRLEMSVLCAGIRGEEWAPCGPEGPHGAPRRSSAPG